jgi:uncharacterized protein (TIGR03084 family)
VSGGAPVDFGALVADLGDEEDALDRIVGGLDPSGWATPTAAAGWDVRATIEHLAGSEALAAVALTEPEAFDARMDARGVPARGGQARGDVRAASAEVLARWRRERARVLDALGVVSARDRFPWVAGDMSAAAFATARLMETWAHGVDVAAALGLRYPATHRLRHVAELGVRTRPFALAAHRVTAPDDDVRVEVVGPDGAAWTWGASDTQVVRGPALDFCLVVTQRRHIDDTRLAVQGGIARQWMAVAQAFAGAPTTAPRGRGV